MKKDTTRVTDEISKIRRTGDVVPYLLPYLKTKLKVGAGATSTTLILMSYLLHHRNKVILNDELYREITNQIKLTKRQIKNSIDLMSKAGILCIGGLSKEKIISNLKGKRVQKYTTEIDSAIHINMCTWCKSETIITHSHHHETHAKDGGETTITLCPNCHSDYHYLLNVKIYRFNLSSLTIMAKINEQAAQSIRKMEE